jgi:NhaP-type Na+/H+ or K+/H+ antiporter
MNLSDLRKPRIFGFTLIDLIPTIIFAIILHRYMWIYPIHDIKDRSITQYILSLLLIIITFIGLGFIFHWIFSIDSKLSFYLGI